VTVTSITANRRVPRACCHPNSITCCCVGGRLESDSPTIVAAATQNQHYDEYDQKCSRVHHTLLWPRKPSRVRVHQQPPALQVRGCVQGAPAALPEEATSATSGPPIVTTNSDNPATASSTPANDNELMLSSSAAPSAEEARHEDDQTQEQESNPEAQPEETSTTAEQPPTPSTEPNPPTRILRPKSHPRP
jgi:hypothetical protein